jgi:hypothetical protein
MKNFNDEYHKINSIYKRDEKKQFIIGDYSCPEYKYLENNLWVGTEKIDGTNIRIFYDGETKAVLYNGKTNEANTPKFLLDKLYELFTIDKMVSVFSDTSVTLYGEGFGARIQKGGGNYIPNGVSFILFDVVIDGWILQRNDVDDIAKKLDIMSVPVVKKDTLLNLIEFIKRKEFNSTFGNFLAEGIVCVPEVEMFNRKGERIITKIKHKDF